MTKRAPATPVRSVLSENSPLLPLVEDGLVAVKKTDRDCFDDRICAEFADSIDVDKALERGHENEHRWDYLLGHAPSGQVVAVEPHSAKQDEISTVIRKREAARHQLKAHLRDGAKVSKWLWVASGKVHFADTEKTKLQLDQNGIEFVGKKVMSKHLPSAGPISFTTPLKSQQKTKK